VIRQAATSGSIFFEIPTNMLLRLLKVERLLGVHKRFATWLVQNFAVF